MTVKVIIVSANEVSTCEKCIAAILPRKYKYKFRCIHTQDFKCTVALRYKTLGRAQDPRANGAWLNKLTE